MKLRDYQCECLEKIVNVFRKSKKQIIQMPTGAGKTIVFWSLIKENYETALIIVPTKNLGQQAYEKGLLFFHESKISRKFGNHNESVRSFHICTIQSIREQYAIKLSEIHDFDIVIIDEAHKAGSASYLEALETLKYKKLLGVTATPTRNDKVHLSKIFGELSYEIDFLSLVKKNHLSEIFGYCYKSQIDLSDCRSTNGEFNNKKLFKLINVDSRNALFLKAFKENCANKKTLIFACNVEHCYLLKYLLEGEGISSEVVHGKMSDSEIKYMLAAFKNGSVKRLINCQLLTEGFDEPSIDCIFIARPTMSPILYFQMVGRGARIHKGKESCMLIEIADNHHRLCNFWTMVAANNEKPYFQKEYKSGVSLSFLKKQYAIEIEVDNLEKTQFDPFEQGEGEFYNYLIHERTVPILTFRECLFLRWKRQKIEEFKKWRLSQKKATSSMSR